MQPRAFMQPSLRLSIERDRAPKEEEYTLVRDGLRAFNDATAGHARVERFAVYLRDDAGAIHGGIVGFFAWQWMSVDWFWVTEAVRGRGYGSELLRAAEAMARDAGCVAV